MEYGFVHCGRRRLWTRSRVRVTAEGPHRFVSDDVGGNKWAVNNHG